MILKDSSGGGGGWFYLKVELKEFSSWNGLVGLKKGNKDDTKDFFWPEQLQLPLRRLGRFKGSNFGREKSKAE